MVLVMEGTISHLEVKPTLEDQIKETQKGHPSIEGIKRKVNSGKASEFTIDTQGILWYGKRLCVPNKEELKQQILAEAHTTPYSIHPGGNQNVQRSSGQILVARDEKGYSRICRTL